MRWLTKTFSFIDILESIDKNMSTVSCGFVLACELWQASKQTSPKKYHALCTRIFCLSAFGLCKHSDDKHLSSPGSHVEIHLPNCLLGYSFGHFLVLGSSFATPIDRVHAVSFCHMEMFPFATAFGFHAQLSRISVHGEDPTCVLGASSRSIHHYM